MKRFILQSLAAVLLLSVCVAGFNLWADPYAIYRLNPVDSDRISRINQTWYMRLSKPWQVWRIKPSAVVIGSSRAGTIRPQHSRWQEDTAFNLSMPGMTIYEMQRLIEHANAQGNLQKLVIGLEYETFLSATPKVGLGFAEARLAGGAADSTVAGILLQASRDIQHTLFTVSSLVNSLLVLAGPEPATARMFADGSWHSGDRSRGGERGFVSSGKYLVRQTRQPRADLDANLALFSDILDLCYRNHIDVRLYISPEHVFMAELRRHIGSSHDWNQFHHRLVSLNQQAADRAGQMPFPLWGFNQLNGVVDEPIQGRSGQVMHWLRDGVHFDAGLGELMMEQIWGSGDLPSQRLDQHSLNAYLSGVDALRQRFVRRQPELVSRYQRQVLD